MFSYNIHTSIDIDASAAAIWRVLTDFGRFDDWNPMLRRVRVDLEPGAAVSFEVHRVGARPLRLRAKIVLLNEPDALAWRGGWQGILSGEHFFRIESLAEKRCRFHHGEQPRGGQGRMTPPTVTCSMYQYSPCLEHWNTICWAP